MPPPGESPRAGLAESEAWKKPGCSLQDLPPRSRPARPRPLNALDREPGCSLQAGPRAASHRVDAAADGCGPRHRDDGASTPSDNRDGLHAISGDYRGQPQRIRDRSAASSAGNHCADAPGTAVGCTPPDQDGAGKAGRLAGNTGSSVAGRSFSSRSVWGPTLRKSDQSRQCRFRVCYRVPTASPPMGIPGAAGAGQQRPKWRYFSPALTLERECVRGERADAAEAGCERRTAE